jgi:tRNA threonylcarbamoyladenosine biosynthesis protein TsaE
MATTISRSVAETVAAGRELGERAQPGNVFALVGDLGAGKTQFVKGIAAGIASPADVTSPTFTLVHEYEGGRVPLYHLDFYRLESKDAALRLGLDDYLFSGGVSVIEWADRFPELLPSHAEWIAVRIGTGDERVIEAQEHR